MTSILEERQKARPYFCRCKIAYFIHGSIVAIKVKVAQFYEVWYGYFRKGQLHENQPWR